MIATGQSAADALSLSSWSYQYHIPILLAKNGKLSNETKALAGKFRKVIIAGAASCCADAEVTSLGFAMGKTAVRLAGKNRYLTSVEIARYFMTAYGPGGSIDAVAFADGADDHFPDALVGGMLAGQKGSPVILVNLKSNASGALTYAGSLLKGRGAEKVYLLGALKEKTLYDRVMQAIR